MKNLLSLASFICTLLAAGYLASGREVSVSHALTKADAETIAQTFVERDGNPNEIVILPDKTKEYVFGFVIQCTPKKVLETGDWKKYGVPGVGQLIVDRADRAVHLVSSSVPPDRGIEIYEKEWKARIR